jgi:hypothetical protein
VPGADNPFQENDPVTPNSETASAAKPAADQLLKPTFPELPEPAGPALNRPIAPVPDKKILAKIGSQGTGSVPPAVNIEKAVVVQKLTPGKEIVKQGTQQQAAQPQGTQQPGTQQQTAQQQAAQQQTAQQQTNQQQTAQQQATQQQAAQKQTTSSDQTNSVQGSNDPAYAFGRNPAQNAASSGPGSQSTTGQQNAVQGSSNAAYSGSEKATQQSTSSGSTTLQQKDTSKESTGTGYSTGQQQAVEQTTSSGSTTTQQQQQQQQEQNSPKKPEEFGYLSSLSDSAQNEQPVPSTAESALAGPVASTSQQSDAVSDSLLSEASEDVEEYTV